MLTPIAISLFHKKLDEEISSRAKMGWDSETVPYIAVVYPVPLSLVSCITLPIVKERLN